MASFEEIMRMPATEIKPPQAFPVGTYVCIVDGPLTPGKSSMKGTDFMQAKFKIIAIGDGVNQQDAMEQQVIGKIVTNDYYITDAAVYRLKEMLEHCGIDDTGKDLQEMVMEAPNKQIKVRLKHDVSQDGKRTFHRVESTSKV